MAVEIRTYDDLEREKVRLTALLTQQGSLIKADVAALKEEMKPVKSVLAFAGKFISKDNKNPVISAGVDIFGDVILKNLLFARAGILTKLIGPYLIKNFSANYLSKNSDNIINVILGKLKSLVGPKKTMAVRR